ITHFLGMVPHSTSMKVSLSQDRINDIRSCMHQFRLGQSVSSLCCQRLLGMMASAAIALPLGMLCMQPFQMWYLSLRLSSTKDRHRRITVTSRCRKVLAIWRTPRFLTASGPMGLVTHRVVVTTDASTKGWGAVCEGEYVNGLWSVAEAVAHINVLELRTVVLALRHFLPRLSVRHVLVRTDNTAGVA